MELLTPLNPIKDEIDITLFVACYNEENGIINTIETIVEAVQEVGRSYEIIVIDDASTDNSVKLVQEYQQKHPNLPIFLKINTKNKGLAHNYIEGAFLGRGKYYRFNCGDDVEPKENFVKLFRQIGKADIIIPYPAKSYGRSVSRKIISKIFTFLVNMISGYRIKYYNGGSIILRYYVMRWSTNNRGFGFQADILTRLLDENMSYIEVPVISRERAGGNSNALTIRNFLTVTHTLIEILVRRIGKIIYGR